MATSIWLLSGSFVVIDWSHNPGFDKALKNSICCFEAKNFKTSYPNPATRGRQIIREIKRIGIVSWFINNNNIESKTV